MTPKQKWAKDINKYTTEKENPIAKTYKKKLCHY